MHTIKKEIPFEIFLKCDIFYGLMDNIWPNKKENQIEENEG
jgi:hypothetical protein